MKKTLSVILAVLTINSCSTAFNVEGTSSISSLDGSKLYLKTVKDENIKSLDSCDVVHGKFRFSGVLDTVRIASLFMDDESLMPVVLEDGEITIQIDRAKQTVSGTALNDTLYKFIDLFNQLDNRMNELGHKQNQMILEGIDENIIMQEVEREAAKIADEREQLMTTSIVQNFNNVLGPYFFEMLTSVYRFPVLTPQIEYIMSKATSSRATATSASTTRRHSRTRSACRASTWTRRLTPMQFLPTLPSAHPSSTFHRTDDDENTDQRR